MANFEHAVEVARVAVKRASRVISDQSRRRLDFDTHLDENRMACQEMLN